MIHLLRKNSERATPVLILLALLIGAIGTIHTMIGAQPFIMGNWFTPWFPFIGMKSAVLLLLPQMCIFLFTHKKSRLFQLFFGTFLFAVGYLLSNLIAIPYFFHASSILILFGLFIWKKPKSFPVPRISITMILMVVLYSVLFMNITPDQQRSLAQLYIQIHPVILLSILYGIVLIKSFQRDHSTLILRVIWVHVGIFLVRALVEKQYPLTTLHETFLFGGFITALLAYKNRGTALHRGGVLITVLLLVLSLTFSTGNFESTTPFLDKKLWLIMHVTSILIGMVTLLWASILGHFQTIKSIITGTTHDKMSIQMNTALEYSLVFMITGTVLGAMWGYDSWGRFWGWDPKENGALLIILWLAFFFCGKTRSLWGRFGSSVVASLSLFFLVFTWIGVNMSSKSLHSYGFSTTGTVLLIGYGLVESLFLVIVCASPFLPSRKDIE